MQAGREVKYQAWIEPTRKMKMVTTLMFDGEGKLIGVKAPDTPVGECVNINSVRLRQFTGLHDKNGKEIYEGDISESDGVLYQVTWSDRGAMYGVKIIKTDSVLTRGLTFPLQPYVIEGTKECNFEIIGNIYENPDLLPAI